MFLSAGGLGCWVVGFLGGWFWFLKQLSGNLPREAAIQISQRSKSSCEIKLGLMCVSLAVNKMGGRDTERFHCWKIPHRLKSQAIEATEGR